MPYHKQGAYDGFDGLQEVKSHYKRCRKLQCFILSKSCINKESITCTICNKPITEKCGNRCEYHPKSKKIACMHYECAWQSIFLNIFLKKDTYEGKLY